MTITIMENEFKIKENLKGDGCNEIKATLFYNKEDYNRKYPNKSYILSILPTKITYSDGCKIETTVPVDGAIIILREVDRKSPKVERELFEELTDEKLKVYINKYLSAYIV